MTPKQFDFVGGAVSFNCTQRSIEALELEKEPSVAGSVVAVVAFPSTVVSVCIRVVDDEDEADDKKLMAVFFFNRIGIEPGELSRGPEGTTGIGGNIFVRMRSSFQSCSCAGTSSSPKLESLGVRARWNFSSWTISSSSSPGVIGVSQFDRRIEMACLQAHERLD